MIRLSRSLAIGLALVCVCASPAFAEKQKAAREERASDEAAFSGEEGKATPKAEGEAQSTPESAPAGKDDRSSSGAYYVSVWKLPLHSGPSGFTKTVSMLPFGAAVTIDDAGKRGAKLPKSGWVRVRAGELEGYVPAGALVSERVMNRQDPSKAMRKARGQGGAGGHNFSEDEDKNDLVAMKGMGGEASAGNADFAAIDRILDAPTEYNPAEAYATFRREGHTAEFGQELATRTEAQQ